MYLGTRPCLPWIQQKREDGQHVQHVSADNAGRPADASARMAMLATRARLPSGETRRLTVRQTRMPWTWLRHRSTAARCARCAARGVAQSGRTATAAPHATGPVAGCESRRRTGQGIGRSADNCRRKHMRSPEKDRESKLSHKNIAFALVINAGI